MMGIEIQVNSLEEMCDLMCDNKLPTPKRKAWIFTFGCGREIYGGNAGKAVKVYAKTYAEARNKMMKKYGTKWAFQYSEKEWEKMKNDPERYWDMEEIVEVIE